MRHSRRVSSSSSHSVREVRVLKRFGRSACSALNCHQTKRPTRAGGIFGPDALEKVREVELLGLGVRLCQKERFDRDVGAETAHVASESDTWWKKRGLRGRKRPFRVGKEDENWHEGDGESDVWGEGREEGET